MAQPTKLRLRSLWLQVHKWIGLLLAVLIIPISLTGSALVWHDWLDETLNPSRHAVTGPASLSPDAYAAAAREALGPEEQLLSLRYPEAEGPIVATATRPSRGEGRPVRTSVWIDPGSGQILDRAGSNEGAVRVLHSLHGSLMVPGLGRQIVGWVGVFMFLSCLTGLWLWWPLTGSIRRGLRWKRQNSTSANLHHQMGFWILLPLAMLSFTGAWISFPQVFGRFEASQPKGGGGGGAAANRERALRAQPLEITAMTATAAFARARAEAEGPLVSIQWPTDQSPEWKIGFAREGGTAEVAVADTGGEVTPPSPPRPETRARLMRRWHDGTGMGALWQTIIFIGGIIPAALAITGIIMWLRSRGWRAKLRRKRLGQPAPQPAE